ncbi:MAG: VIT1/CCC1 transporter family protein [Acidimicrobiia bacterium]|nr:MAG: VIT1/CCC1 transporter family protein [Acidimicrobiia bacterium]
MDEVASTEHPYEPHLGDSRQYWRDMILGVNDGLVSIFLLVAGVVGGQLASRQVLLTAIAGAVAGAISMATGEWLATKSQEEVFDREIALEREHIKYHRDSEIEQLWEMLGNIGLEGEPLAAAVEQIGSSDERLMQSMKVLEFGVLDEERRSPWKAAWFSGVLFLTGALPSVVPFVFITDTFIALIWAGVLSGFGLFAVGAAKSMATKTNPWRSGAENLGVSLLGAVLSFWVGRAYDATF